MAHETFLGSIFKHGFRSKYLQKWLNSSFMKNISNKISGNALTQAEVQANEFSAGEAQKNRDFQQQMSDTSYQRGVADMQQAGLNPALMYGGGASGASTPSGAVASSVSPTSGMSMSELLQLISLPLQMKQLAANVKKTDAEASDIAENAKDRRRGVDISDFRAQFEKLESQSRVAVNDANIGKINDERNVLVKQLAKIDSDMALNLSNEQLNAAQKHLADVNAESILQLLPFHQRLMSAQTEHARSQAALLELQKIYQSKLWTDDYINAVISSAISQAEVSDASALRATFNAALESGDWSALGRDSGINKVAAHIVSALMIAFKIPFSGLAAFAK